MELGLCEGLGHIIIGSQIIPLEHCGQSFSSSTIGGSDNRGIQFGWNISSYRKTGDVVKYHFARETKANWQLDHHPLKCKKELGNFLKKEIIELEKEGYTVSDTIDLRDLPEEEIKLVQEFVEFLRKKAESREKKEKKGEKIVFAAWPLGIKGKPTRRDVWIGVE